MTNQDDEATKNLVTATEAKLRQEYDLTKAPGYKMYPDVDHLCRKWSTLRNLYNAYLKAFNFNDTVKFIYTDRGMVPENIFCKEHGILIQNDDGSWGKFQCQFTGYGLSGLNNLPFAGAVLGIVGARIALMGEGLPAYGEVKYQNEYWCDPVKLGEDCLYEYPLMFEQALVDFSSRMGKERDSMARNMTGVKTAIHQDVLESMEGIDVYRPDPSKEWFIAKDSVTGTSVTFFGLHCANPAMENIRQARVARVAKKLKGEPEPFVGMDHGDPTQGYQTFIKSQMAVMGVPIQKHQKDFIAAIYKKGTS